MVSVLGHAISHNCSLITARHVCVCAASFKLNYAEDIVTVIYQPTLLFTYLEGTQTTAKTDLSSLFNHLISLSVRVCRSPHPSFNLASLFYLYDRINEHIQRSVEPGRSALKNLNLRILSHPFFLVLPIKIR